MRTADIFAWMKERHTIYTKKMEGAPKPWTQDNILQSYRFCNVYRELDSVTAWIRENWREPQAQNPDLWFAMTLSRLVNWPDTLGILRFGREDNFQWNPLHFFEDMKFEQAKGKKVFSGAYIVSTNGYTMDKAEYLAKHVLDPLWAAREEIRPRPGDSLETFFGRLSRFNGLGSFMSGQVIADTKYAGELYKSPDWWQWATPGPGSKRGLNRVYNYPVDHPWTGRTWHQHHAALLMEIEPLVAEAGMPDLHAQDLQNCLCEFDKYERTRLGEGRPRSTYPGGR